MSEIKRNQKTRLNMLLQLVDDILDLTNQDDLKSMIIQVLSDINGSTQSIEKEISSRSKSFETTPASLCNLSAQALMDTHDDISSLQLSSSTFTEKMFSVEVRKNSDQSFDSTQLDNNLDCLTLSSLTIASEEQEYDYHNIDDTLSVMSPSILVPITLSRKFLLKDDGTLYEKFIPNEEEMNVSSLHMSESDRIIYEQKLILSQLKLKVEELNRDTQEIEELRSTIHLVEQQQQQQQNYTTKPKDIVEITEQDESISSSSHNEEDAVTACDEYMASSTDDQLRLPEKTASIFWTLLIFFWLSTILPVYANIVVLICHHREG